MMDPTKDIVAPVLAGVIVAVIIGVASQWKSARDWFKAQQWAVGALSGLIAAVFASWAFTIIIKQTAPDNVIPPNAILAFDGPCPDPKKWEPYDEGKGRVMLGAGKTLTGAYGNVNQFPVETLPGSSGGTELQFQGPLVGNLDKSALFLSITAPLNSVVVANGEGGTHALKYYILPPYIALTFCKKK